MRLYSHTSIQSQEMIEEVKNFLLQGQESAIVGRLPQIDRESAEVENSIQHFSSEGSIQNLEPSEELAVDRQELLYELQQQRASIDIYRKTCEEAISKLTYERTGQRIKGVKATNFSRVIAGSLNTSGMTPNHPQDISDVTADCWSITMAGTFANVEFDKMLPPGPPK